MTSPEWEAANEDDSDRFPQPSPHVAPPPVVDPLRSDPARVARWEFLVQNTADYWPRQKAEAAMRLADEEHAALVGEVERLRANWAHGVDEDGNLPPYCVPFKAHFTVSDELTARAEAAEAKLAKVEALAQRWVGMGILRSMEGTVSAKRGRELRAVLADAPAEQRTLNCPVCGSGEEGDCICEAAEAIAKAKWEASGLAVREGPWSAVGIIKRRSLIIKALPEAAEQTKGGE